MESGLLTAAGAIAGLGFALSFRGLLPALIPPTPQPVQFALSLNWRIATLALAGAVVTLGLAGLVPAVRASRLNPAVVIRSTAPIPGSRRTLIQRGLVVLRIAVASMALVAPLFFLISLRGGARVDPGFANPEAVLLLGVDFNAAGLDQPHGLETIDRLLLGIGAQAGVQAAAAATMVPLGAGGHRFAPTKVEGYDPPATEDLNLEQSQVTPGYFELMGIAVVRGRRFSARAREASGLVAVVNQAFANRYWPGQEPLGHRTLAEHASVSTYPSRLGSVALGGFGLLALGLAMVGLYAVVSSTTGQERRDTAIRMSLGATAGRVGGRMVGRAVQLAMVGSAAGLAGGFALVTAIADRLIGIHPSDPVVYVVAAAACLTAMAGAAYWPA